jgi:hypothetical protein
MTTQAKLIYGLKRSPILAHFQNMPTTPSLFLSMMPGAKWCTYALVQITRRMTRRRDWKLKSAVILAVMTASRSGLGEVEVGGSGKVSLRSSSKLAVAGPFVGQPPCPRAYP